MMLDIGDNVWIDPTSHDLVTLDEFSGEYVPDGHSPVSGEITGVCWSSTHGAWYVVEFPTEPYTNADGRTWSGTHERGLDVDLVVHVPSATFPGHDVPGV